MVREQLGEDGEDRARLWSWRGRQYQREKEDDGKSTGMKKGEGVGEQGRDRRRKLVAAFSRFQGQYSISFSP